MFNDSIKFTTKIRYCSECYGIIWEVWENQFIEINDLALVGVDIWITLI